MSISLDDREHEAFVEFFMTQASGVEGTHHEESADELVDVEVDGGPLVSFAVLISETNSAFVDGEDPAIGYGATEGVSGQVLQNSLTAIDGRFDEGTPFFRGARKGSGFRERFAAMAMNLSATSFVSKPGFSSRVGCSTIPIDEQQRARRPVEPGVGHRTFERLGSGPIV